MSTGYFLTEHHHHLERLFEALVARAQEGDHAALRAEWSRFERELLAHLEVEETHILPAFGRGHPREAARIWGEHAQIRAALTEMGVCLDLHLLRAQAIEDLVRRLAEHARHEEAVLYPVARRTLDGAQRQWIRRELGLEGGGQVAAGPDGQRHPAVR
jgi:hemerythrin superfamily protein